MRLAMEAADYTPGEADQLRRDMATWRRHGPIESHHQRLVSRMTAKGIAAEFAERVFQQIKGFGEYGFPESHAASFALIAYATAWLKCHHPEVFACSLLNAQPMGFYSGGTIVEDARRHGIAVLPVDVTVSAADCTLEEVPAGDGPPPRRRPLGVRMGLRWVQGLRSAGIAALVTARRERLFVSISDLARRTRLADDELKALARADAFAAFAPERRQALWAVHGLSRRDPPGQLLLPLDDPAPAPRLPALSELEEVNWDWSSSGHSTRAHLLEPLRAVLRERGWPTAAELNTRPHGRRADYVGVVICRQRPHTAKGVTFMTLEDETGFVNLVLWAQVWDEFKVLAKTLALMGVSGRIQSEDSVVHLVADRIWEPRLEALPAGVRSRDFH